MKKILELHGLVKYYGKQTCPVNSQCSNSFTHRLHSLWYIWQNITNFRINYQGLDELPQFINTFIGNMSLVGPRPHMLKHTDQYQELVPKYMVRHLVKPGITGWAQVNGYRGETKEVELMKKRVEYDLYYIENWSFWFDIKILLLTLWVVLKGQEMAYW